MSKLLKGKRVFVDTQVFRFRLTCYVRFSVDSRLAFSFYGQDTW